MTEKYPCYECEYRQPGCQDHCELYIEHRNKAKARKEATRIERDACIMQDRYEKEKIARLKG